MVLDRLPDRSEEQMSNRHKRGRHDARSERSLPATTKYAAGSASPSVDLPSYLSKWKRAVDNGTTGMCSPESSSPDFEVAWFQRAPTHMHFAVRHRSRSGDSAVLVSPCVNEHPTTGVKHLCRPCPWNNRVKVLPPHLRVLCPSSPPPGTVGRDSQKLAGSMPREAHNKPR